jgi:peptidoglycan-N-acetylglucosamine deacetylase
VRSITLTVDTEYPDRPCSDPLRSLDELLAVLAAHQTRATFFIVGGWAKANRDRVAAIHEAGHDVGNHSYSHCNLSRMTDEGIISDLAECNQVLAELGIESRPRFRAPYGEMGTDGRIDAAVASAGYRHSPWNVDSHDWRPEATADQIADDVLRQLSRRWPRSATILFHSWPDATSQAVGLLLEQLADRRVAFTTVQ